MAATFCPICGAWIHHDDSNKDALASHNKEMQHPEPEPEPEAPKKKEEGE